MKRKKQLLTLVMAFVLAFTSLPAANLFAKVYDIHGAEYPFQYSIDGVVLPGKPTTFEVGDTIKDSTLGEGFDLRIYYYQDDAAASDALDNGGNFRKDGSSTCAGYLNDQEHIVLGPEAAGVTVPAGKRLSHWNVKYLDGSGGFPTEIVLSAVWEDIYTVSYDANGGEGTPPIDTTQYLPGE